MEDYSTYPVEPNSVIPHNGRVRDILAFTNDVGAHMVVHQELAVRGCEKQCMPQAVKHTQHEFTGRVVARLNGALTRSEYRKRERREREQSMITTQSKSNKVVHTGAGATAVETKLFLRNGEQ